jgi:hypothetical protein
MWPGGSNQSDEGARPNDRDEKRAEAARQRALAAAEIVQREREMQDKRANRSRTEAHDKEARASTRGLLFRKKSPHEQAIRDEERSLKRLHKTHRKERKEAERALDSAREGEQVARLGDARLFKDRIEKGSETVPLVPGMRAEIEVTGSVSVVSSTYTTKDSFRKNFLGDASVQSQRVLGPKIGQQVERTVDTRKVTLTVETDRAGLVLSCQPGEETAAREFAQKVRILAADGPGAANARDIAVRAAEQALAELDRRHSDQVAEQATRIDELKSSVVASSG